ncbi:MAG TPA: ABC transporter permease subunit [Planctomycetota bacterium]|nr:ABC transporter permease subunit [Planctomycetota bacterium]
MRFLLGRDSVALKELRGVSRRWQTYVGRCLYVGITAALLYQYWKDNWVTTPDGELAMSVSQYAALGRAIFERCEWVSLVLTVLAAVIAGAEMIARETRAGTLDLLLLTPLTPFRVVLGKWKAAMMIAGALYLCSIPVLAIAVYLGGVGPIDLARSAGFTLGMTSVAGALGLYSSARLKTAGAAVAATVPLVLGMFVVFRVGDLVGKTLLEICLRTSPLLVHPGGVSTLLIAIVATLAVLRAAVRQVRIRTGEIPGQEDHARELRTLALDELREKRGTRPPRPLLRWRSVWEGNPLVWKEFTLRPALRIREDWRARSYIFLYFIFLASWVASGFKGGAGFFALWGSFFAVVAGVGGSLLFAPEKEGRQWLLLLSTPVTPGQIVRAKLLCGLIFPEALGMIQLYVLAIAAWLGFQDLAVLLGLTWAATLFLLFCYALSAAASLRVRTARTAFLFTAGVVAALVTLPPLVSGALRHLAGIRPSIWNDLWNWFEALDPVLVFDRFEIRPRSPSRASDEAMRGLLRFTALYLPLTLLLPVEMILRFRRIAIHA